MSLSYPVANDHQLARLLQIGMVLEEVIEARAGKHYETLADEERDDVETLLEHAATESARHRGQLEALIDTLDADPVAYEEIEQLVAARYESDTDTDGVLYDQLANEETAYKFYDDLIEAIEGSNVEFGLPRSELLDTLREIRADEKTGVEDVTQLMETR
ncbi:rubrerythrin [Halobacteriales archaeon SW_8_65_20]|nr:MAG: rubrerythrin [Halobacteriales archaeon QH_7_65_31]PSQ29642.1 MAG: rubrerythrin [Halobacteriales archaeon SW_6_65_46]PSQ54095.1 MAG: rubrerythrin [Halobacteriales archaeon SW_8_65_20]